MGRLTRWSADGTSVGPVKNPSEKQRIAVTAVQMAGAGKVHNDLEIAQ